MAMSGNPTDAENLSIATCEIAAVVNQCAGAAAALGRK
jgi:hypothetical protein